MADRRHSDESHPNAGDSSGPESLVSQAELLRPEEIPGLAPPPLRDSGGIRLFAALKNVRGHERSYQIRRAGVISLGFSIVVALLATISWVKSL
ncbi:MAG: hypothetical protein ACE5GA_02130, partial [Candidatus Zixiibacteriota bacterium]